MKENWWKEAVVYQVYPKSFQDSNGDGIGDIQGIISRLDYLKDLGIDVLWICPIYKSPMDDGGYDISDYYTIDERFGSNEDFDELLEKATKLGIKVLMDLVVNHTSDEHDWFQQALKDPASKYRNYYIFREGIDGKAPNNWRSYFGDSAWTAVPGENNLYYLHAFTKKQPDLNWENEVVRQEIYKMINYWLDKGLAGFRIDAILNIKKRIELKQFEPDGEDGLAFIGHWILNQPGIEVWLNEMNEKTFKLHNSMTVAEADVPNERLKDYIGPNGFFSMVFDFSYTDIDVPQTGEWYKFSGWTWDNMRENIFLNQLVTQANGWGALYLENHDQPRSINKYVQRKDHNDYSKKMLATLFMLLRGTPFIYQGQELGMTNIQMETMEDFDDIATHDQYRRAVLSGMSEQEAFEAVSQRSRDNSRTPMQWDASKNAGFSSAEKTWLKVNPNYKELNSKQEKESATSVLNYYKQLIALRKSSQYKNTIVHGEFVPVKEVNTQTLVYERKLSNQTLFIAVNPTDQIQRIARDTAYTHLVLSNYSETTYKAIKDADAAFYDLRPYESIILANEKE